MNANPRRASKIWQYVYVIHTAAAANPWDNVYFYDVNSWLVNHGGVGGKLIPKDGTWHSITTMLVVIQQPHHPVLIIIQTKIGKVATGRMNVAGALTKIDARDQAMNVILIIGAHIVQGGTMDILTAGKG